MTFEILGTTTFVLEEDMKAQALKVLEEASELVEAVKAYKLRDEDPEASATIVQIFKNNAGEEIADVLQATFNLAAMMGWNERDINRLMRDCHERNEQRGRYE